MDETRTDHRNVLTVTQLNTCIKTCQAHSQRVEYLRQYTTRQTDSEESDIREYIAQQACYIIIGIPQSRSGILNEAVEKYILERLALHIVQEEHQHCTHTHCDIEWQRRGCIARNNPTLVEHLQTSCEAATEQYDKPTQLGKNCCNAKVNSLEYDIE